MGTALRSYRFTPLLRYCLFALILADSPIKARRRLRHGQLAYWRHLGAKPGAEFTRFFEEDLNKYYPRYARWSAGGARKFADSSSTETLRLEPPTIPLPVRIIGQVHNLDYWLPVLANIVALVTYALHRFALI